ncbi:MAG TPA: GNAT family N-acetyltransferase [Salinimicrobium sp.]|nr:GNAT family N-acetyltransferase [Salinimicrobium sp.]
MEIREGKATDILEIIKVLKASLGEKDLPISEQIWNFKHVDNPFGKSIVLLALQNDEIVGVRAFMRWKWSAGNKNYSCFRAVDTATHPNHQGKGIFKKLTLKAVEIAKKDGDDFIFNTPNDKSRPGYLKMGWETAGKLEIGIRPAFSSFWKILKQQPNYQRTIKASAKEIESLCATWNADLEKKNAFFTRKSAEYLAWRFENNPLQEYEVYATPDFYLAACTKSRGKITELRVVECIYSNPVHFNEIKKIIKYWSKKFGAQAISFSPKVNKMPFPVYKGDLGPILTVKDLNLTEELKSSLLQIPNWNYSLGDMELF